MNNNKIFTLGGSVLNYTISFPVKGDLINMDLDGNGNKTYRVLNMNDNVAKVVAMYNIADSQKYNTTSITKPFDSLTVQDYMASDLDYYLIDTWYNTLTSTTKTAIVPKNILLDVWYLSTNSTISGNPTYSGTSGTTIPGTTDYSIGQYSDYVMYTTRKIYALSIQDIIDYLSDDDMKVDISAILRNVNIWKMFWNIEVQPNNSTSIWLRSASADNSDYVWFIDSDRGMLRINNMDYNYAVRPAFHIDLSKIPFTKTMEVTS